MGNANFRKISTEEKRSIGNALTLLSPEDLSKALEIIAQSNPSFQSAAEEIEIDMDAQVRSDAFLYSVFNACKHHACLCADTDLGY